MINESQNLKKEIKQIKDDLDINKDKIIKDKIIKEKDEEIERLKKEIQELKKFYLDP